MSQIFRKEALEYSQNRLQGEVVLGTPLPTALLSYGLAAAAFCALVFSCIATYTQQETVPGWIAGKDRIVHVSANRAGVIQDLRVREGQIVPAGTPLVQFRAGGGLGEQSSTNSAPDQGNIERTEADTIITPVAGRVVAIPVEPGDAISSGAPVALVVPSDLPRGAELFVPSHLYGLVKTGQTVSLRIQALPSPTFGDFPGVVTDVSEAVVDPSDLHAPGNVEKESVFRVKVALLPDPTPNAQRFENLQPGMLLNADIDIDRRPLIAWLLPLSKRLGHH